MSTSSSSTSTPPPSLPLPQLLHHSNAYACTNGLQTQLPPPSNGSYQCAPYSLLPNAYPHDAFHLATSLAPSFNRLVDAISQDVPFLAQALGTVSDQDVFTRQLLSLYSKIYGTEDSTYRHYGKFAREADRLGILRSDYMLTPRKNGVTTQYELKQVELNTIASAFGALSTKVAEMHRSMMRRFPVEGRQWMEYIQQSLGHGSSRSSIFDTDGVPENPALTSIAQSMNIAHQHYLHRYHPTTTSPIVILFLVQPEETNSNDQDLLELELFHTHHISVLRLSFTDGINCLHFDETSGVLTVCHPDDSTHTPKEVSVCYFRAGYAPEHYPSTQEWETRERIERSRCTKCPCLGYHLAGTKKVQQCLARHNGTLERYLTTQEEADAMKLVFAGLYSLDDDDDEDLSTRDKVLWEILTPGFDGSQRHVLKPQREGGGHNYFNQELVHLLRPYVHWDTHEDATMDSSQARLGKELSEYILMERLFPPRQHAVLVRSGTVENVGETVSELGCFGCILVYGNECEEHGGKIVHNEYSGFLLRTKFDHVDEGGVVSGFSTLSSPYLC